jgi:hypothetical protein
LSVECCLLCTCINFHQCGVPPTKKGWEPLKLTMNGFVKIFAQEHDRCLFGFLFVIELRGDSLTQSKAAFRRKNFVNMFFYSPEDWTKMLEL